MIRFPDQKFTVICLANLNSLDPSQLALRVADLYLADQFTEQEPLANQGVLEVAELPTNHLESLSGYYRNQKGGNILKLATQEGKLVGELLGLSFQLIATSSTHLKAIATSFDIQIEFEDAQPDEARRLHLSSLRGKPEMYQKVATTLVMPSQLADYVGVYQSDELKNSYSILLAEEQLLLKRGYLPTEMLHPVTPDLFISCDLVIQFERNEREQVCAFKLDAGRVRGIHFIK